MQGENFSISVMYGMGAISLTCITRTPLYSSQLVGYAEFYPLYTQGGPGHFYLMKNMPVTPAKIRSNVELLE